VEDFIWRDGLLLGSQRPVEMGGRRHFHLDHLGTPRLITSDNGQLVSYHDYYPFGDEKSSYWQEVAGGFDREEPMKFTGHERDYALGMGAEDGHAVDYMHARYYSPTGGRFLSPDPLGGHMEDPQTLNRYAYAGNNPITLTDPTGLDFYLQCKGNSDTCHDGHVGTSATDANGNVTFSATVVTSASLQNAKSGNRGTVNENGVQITTGGHTYQGIFINNTQSADLSGSGRLQGFNFHIGSSDEKHGVLSAGDFTFNANRDQTRSTLDRRGAFRSIADSRFVTGLSPDEVMFHLFTTQHRFGTGPSPHFSVPDIPTNAVPTRGPFHVDKDVVGLKHLGCATMGVGCN
jgi:RHS repeat-associated protein